MKRTALLYLILLAGVQPIMSQSCPLGLSGNFKIGPTGNYATLGAALNDLHTKGLSGPALLELQATYTSAAETFPIAFNAVTCSSPANSITIRPEAGAPQLVIAANDTIAAIDIVGGNYYVLDGRPGGTGTSKNLSIRNSNPAGNTISLVVGASNNILKHLDLQGVSNGILSGVILFGAADNSTGIAHNLVDSCDIHAGATSPLYGILATDYHAAENKGNTIKGCNVYNIAGNDLYPGVGIYVEDGYDSFSVTGNSVYQTGNILPPSLPAGFPTGADTPYRYTAISVGSAYDGGHIVSGNFVGGSAPAAGGSPMVLSACSVFIGINVSSMAGPGMASQVSNNTITNLLFEGNSAAWALPIQLGGGPVGGYTNFNGACTGNTIGNMGPGYSIQRIGPAPLLNNNFTLWGISLGLYYSDCTIDISGNHIGGIMTDNQVSAGISGIEANGPSLANSLVLIDSNQIGDESTANSISVGNAVAASGITLSDGNNQQGDSIAVTGNHIANLTANGWVQGIRYFTYNQGNPSISGNTIHDLTSTGNALASPIAGIYIYHYDGDFFYPPGSFLACTDNKIASISYTGALSGLEAVEGIDMNISGTGTEMQFDISRNTVSALTAPTGSIVGINAGSTWPDASTVDNNMIDLGLTAAGLPIGNVTELQVIGLSAYGHVNVLHNSIYVHSPAPNVTNYYQPITECLLSDTGTKVIMNNIFELNLPDSDENGRVIVLLTHNVANIQSDYNIYYVAGDTANRTIGVGPGFIAGSTVDSTLAQWQALYGLDQHSIYGDPLFKHPEDSWPNLDLHLQQGTRAESAGTAAYTTLTDFDGKIRADWTPVDIGADAGNFKGPVIPDSVARDTASFVHPYPNPFAGTLNLGIVAQQAGTAYLTVYTSNGALVTTFQANVIPGNNTVNVPMSPFPNGLYVIRVDLNGQSKTMLIWKTG